MPEPRDTPSVRPGPRIRVESRKTQGLDTAFIDTLDKSLSARERAEAVAQRRADRLRLAQFKNDVDAVVSPATQTVAASKGLNVYEDYHKQKTGVLEHGATLLDKMPDHLKEEAKIALAGKVQGFEKVSFGHALKEHDTAADNIYTTRAENQTQDLVLMARDTESFAKGLVELSRIGDEHAEFKGLSAEEAKLNNEKMQSTAILKSLQAMEGTSDLEGAREFFNNWKGDLVTNDLIKAQSIMESVERVERSTEAKNWAEKARNQFYNDASGAHRFLEKNIKDGDTFREARQFYDVDFKVRERQRKLKAEANEALAYNTVAQNNGLVTDAVRRLVPADKIDDLHKFANTIADGKLVQTDWKLYNQLRDEAFRSPDVFAERQMGMFQGKINFEQMQNLRSLQQDVRNRAQSRKDKLQYQNSERADRMVRRILADRGVDPILDPEEYGSYISIGRDIFEDTQRRLPDEQDPRVLEREFEKSFRARTLPREIDKANPFLEFFNLDSDEFKQLTVTEVERRARENRPLYPRETADPAVVERVKKLYRARRGSEPTDDQIQRILDNMVGDTFKVLP